MSDMFKRIKGKLILAVGSVGIGVGAPLIEHGAIAQVADKGLTPAANTSRSFRNAPINRASGAYQPLNLLNDFYPSIVVEFSKHDNVRRRPDIDEDDFRIDVSPSLGYRTNIGRHQFYAAYQGRFTFHDELEQEDAESNTFSANLGLDLTRRWDLELFGSIGESFERRGISGGRAFSAFNNNGFDSGPETVDFVSYGADLIFGRKIGIIQGVLGYEYTGTGFKSDDLADITNFSDSRDRSTETVHFDLNWQFADRTSVFGRVQRTETDYDRDDVTLDGDQTDYLVGLRWKPANSLSGTVGVGLSEKNFDDPARDRFDGSVYYTNLNYAINPFSTINLSASRTVEEPGDEFADFYESEFIGVGWDHSLNSRFKFGLYAKAIDDDYDTGREDQFFDWGAELQYAWRNWMTASIYYGEIERESNRDNITYDDTYFGLRLRSDLRSLLRSGKKSEREPASFGKAKKSEFARKKSDSRR